MRILMLSQFYPPILGGIERHVNSLSTELAARGHQVAVATLWHPGQPEFVLDGAVRVYRVRSSTQRFSGLFTSDRFHAPPFPDPELMLALRRVIKQERPEIIHAHNWIVHSFLPLKRWSRARLVMTLHDSELKCVQMRYMYQDRVLCSGPGFTKCLGCSIHHYGSVKGAVTWAGNGVMSKFQRSGVDLFLPVSTAIAKTNGLFDREWTRRKTLVVPNFIPDGGGDAGDQPDLPVEGLPAEPYILQVGDLVADKGIFVLLEAYQSLRNAPPLVLIGRRTPESPTTLPPNVTLLESLPHPLVMRAWRRSLFGVVPSINIDASPTVTLEAMVSGKAVVGSRIGGIVDQIVEGETGLLVPPNEPDALCNALQQLIDQPALREKMGAAARMRVGAFQAGSVVSRIEKAYLSL